MNPRTMSARMILSERGDNDALRAQLIEVEREMERLARQAAVDRIRGYLAGKGEKGKYDEYDLWSILAATVGPAT